MNSLGQYSDVEIAHVAHEACRGMQAVHEAHRRTLLNPGAEQIPVAPPWEQLPPDDRDTAVEQVHAIRTGFVASPESSHKYWCGYLHERGWTWGRHLDPAARTHPNLVGWHDLPATERDKHIALVAVVNALLRTDRHL